MGSELTIIVITYRRPDSVRRCLTHLAAQTEPADQIVVIDGSEDHATASVVAEFADVEYFHNAAGAGNMTSSRNYGLERARGEVIAFLDDDAYVEPDYIANLRRAYADGAVGLACSRTLNGLPGEEAVAQGGVGKLLPDGQLSGNFAFNTRATVEIDHGIGATMSFRRSTLQNMGGFREDYGGTSLREDTDAFLRAQRLGFRAVFVHDAVAHHVAAPQAKGRRFDLRYEYWACMNHALLLANNFGVFNLVLPRYAATYVTWNWQQRERRLSRRLARILVGLSGFAWGAFVAIRRQRGRPTPPDLQTARAAEIRLALQRSQS